MRILYLGGILSLFTIYNVVLLAARRFYLALLISVTAAALGLAGGLFVALTQGTLNRFAWIFVASQAVAALGFAAASEREARRQTVKECEEGGPQSSNFVRRSL
jgi:hypothetical protein